MKTKIGIFLFFTLFFQFSLNAQNIVGEDFLCLGDCGYYYVIDANGQEVIEEFEWDFGDGNTYVGPNATWCPWFMGPTIITAWLNGTIYAEFQFQGSDCCFLPVIDGPTELCVGECGYYVIQGSGGPYDIFLNNGQTLNNGEFCPTEEGIYELIVTDFNGCSSVQIITVTDIGSVEIFSQSGAFCLDDDLSNCDRVCENTTVVYTTDANALGVPIVWSVSGAENWEANGNEVTVEWGDPGQGQVSVEVGDVGPPEIQILCAQIGDFDPSMGVAPFILNIEGPSNGPYFVDLNNGASEFITGSGQNTWSAPFGTSLVTVQDNFGNSATCILEIIDSRCIYINAIPSNTDLCEFCETSIDITVNPIPGSGGPGPYTYTWSTNPPQTTSSLVGVCEGEYTVTVTDAEGCTGEMTIPIACGSSSACSGSNSLCVDILELPEAAFETNPPANNNIIEICEGQTVFFDNLTYGGFNYTWDFGDGISSSLVDAEHTYLSAGTYEAVLIARNDCFCSDSSSVTIIVEEAITPEIDCAGTICPGEEITYTSNADCSIFYWNISSNGTIISGGGLSDDFITVDWGAGPEGIIELSVGGCNGGYCVQTLFESIPIIDDNAEIQGPIRVCKGAEVIYSMPAFAGTEFVWGVTGFGTITEGQGTNEITVQWANELTNQAQQVTVDYESCYLGCGGSDVLNVNILNEIFIEGPIQACPNQMETYTCRTPSGNPAQASWTVTNTNGVVVATSAGVTPDFEVDWMFGSGNYIVHAEVTNPTAYCLDNFSIFVEVVNPTTLSSSIDGVLEICPGTSYTYTGNSFSGGFDYTWYVTDGASNYILNGKTVNVIWGPNPPYLLELTQTNLNGFACESEAISASPFQISTVALNGPQTLCKEEVATYTATDFPNLEYEWQVIPADAGSIISGDDGRTVDIQWNSSGIWNVQVTVCGVSASLPVTVNQLPNPIPVFDPVCPGQTGPVSLSQSYTNVVWKNEFGTTISTNPVANLGSGYYEVIVTDNNGCENNEAFFVGSYGQPDVTISTPDFGSFCLNGGSMTLYALESSSGPLDYQWYYNGTPFGSNSSAQVISQEGSYYVEVTDINGCTDFSNTLSLNCVDLPGPPSICLPDGYIDFEMSAGVFCNQSEYTNTSLNDVDDSWTWQFRDVVGGSITNSTLENPSHTWTNAGFNIVIFTAFIKGIIPGEPCPMSIVQFDTIPLVANFIFEGTCVDEPISFTDISAFIPQTNISEWSWEFGDPASGAANTSSLQNPQHSYSASGLYTVTLTTTDESGCVSVKQDIVEIVDSPLASFSIPATSCEGASLAFQANGSFTDISWDFGDPASGAANTASTAQSNHVFSNPGVYTVTLYVESVYGCQDSVSQEVTIEANSLTGNIIANPGLEVCQGDSVVLTAPVADSYAWSTGQSASSITVFDAGSYKVTIYDAVGCGYTTPEVVIDLIPLPQGEITAVEYNEYEQPTDVFYNSYETCFGDDVYLLMTDNPNYTYEWPNGETTTEVSFTDDKDNLLSVGTHTFEVEITDQTTGCMNTVGPFTVTVHPIPEDVEIISMPAAPVCENIPTVISVVNPDPNFTYIWNTGEVGTTINTFYAGKYFVRAINQFSCEAESNTLEIVPGPNVDLIPSGCHTRCNPDTICLPPVLGVSSFQWYLNGTAIPAPEGNDPNYIATESGEYYVEMISVDGCVTISDFLTLDLYDGFGSILGNVYFDLNGNGIIDAADTLMNGIDIILQQNGVNVDTLTSNQIGSFAFANILSTDYEIIVDELNLPDGMNAIIAQAFAPLNGCDDEEMIEFLIEFNCAPIAESLQLNACPGQTVFYDGTELNIGDIEDFTFTTGSGCDSTVTVSVDSFPQSFETIQLSACENEMVDYNGTDLLADSTYYFTYANVWDCDSTVTVIVGVLENSTNAINLQACTGSTVDYNGTALSGGTITDFTFENAVGCDSIVTVTVVETDQDSSSLNLETCLGSTIEYDGTDLSPGDQMDFTFTNTGGCDSIVTVIVEPYPIYNMTENLEACVGESIDYNGTSIMAGETMTFNYLSINDCDSTVVVSVSELMESTNDISFQACTGSTVTYNGTALSGGTITDFTFENAAGCDSIVTVTVVETDQDSSSLNLETCLGSTIEYNGTDLSPGDQMDFTFTNTGGCDSIVTVIVDNFPNYNLTENLEACTGQMVEYNGTEILAGTSMTFDFTTIDNCDSVVTVVVAELVESTEAIQLSACENSTVDYNGNTLLAGSVTDFTFINANNCDSIVTVTVLELNLDSSSLQLETCIGSTVNYNGTDLEAGDQTDFVLTNSNGCDSIVTVMVEPLDVYSNTEHLSACPGESVTYNGTNIMAGDSMAFSFTSASNCDSIITVYVAELMETTGLVELEACENGTVDYNGTMLLPGTETDFTFENQNGCDSIVTVFVEELFNTSYSLELEACQGNSVIYDGVPLFPGTETDFTFENAIGCDSVVTVSVAELPLYDFELELSACEGSFVEYAGDTLMAGSTSFYSFTTSEGCDSSMTVIVEALSHTDFTLSVSICDEDTYPFNGENLPPGSSTDFVFTNAVGCDSIVTVNITAFDIEETFLEFTVCNGEEVDYNGNDLEVGFDDTFIFTDANGCDSLVNIVVNAYPDFDFEVSSSASCWNENDGQLIIENLSGGVGPFQFSIDGTNYQDSLSFENIGNGVYPVSVIDGNGCEEILETELTEIPPLEILAEIPEIPCDFSPVILELSNESQNAGTISYLWNDGTEGPFITVDTPAVFNVEISNSCETIIEEYFVPLAADGRREYFYVPNLFSPNNDGMNDVWQVMPPEDMEVLSFELKIFDRWGNHLKDFESVYDSWDGTMRDQELKPGVYVWWYRASVVSCGKVLEVFKKGDVTIVR